MTEQQIISELKSLDAQFANKQLEKLKTIIK